MAHIKKCSSFNAHEPHEWDEYTLAPNYREDGPDWGREVFQINYCEGREREQSLEGQTAQLKSVAFRDLTKVSFEFLSREKVDTEIIFQSLQAGDARATIAVVDEDADGWAYVEIKLLARKPYIAREVEE